VSRNTRISSSVTELFPPLPEPRNINSMEQYLHCAKDRQYYIYDMQLPSPSLLNDTLCWAQTRAVWPAGRTFINCGSNRWLIDKFLCYLLPLFQVIFFAFIWVSLWVTNVKEDVKEVFTCVNILFWHAYWRDAESHKNVRTTISQPSFENWTSRLRTRKWVFQREVLYVVSSHW
jgi:hypothetical protein